MAVLAPVHGLTTAIDHSGVEHGLEDLNIGGIVLVVEREIRVIPIAEHAQAAETGLLKLDVLDGKLVAHLADLRRGRRVELRRTELLLHLVLNGLAVAVPAGDVGGLLTQHGVVAHDHVFGDLVHGVADVDGAVRVWRAVVQHELLVPFVLLLKQLVDPVFVPCLKALGLGLVQARAHGEARLRQVHGLLVLALFLRHGMPSPSRLSRRPGAAPRRSDATATPPALGANKKAPVPASWDEALDVQVVPAKALRLKPPSLGARAPVTRLAYHGGHPGDAY